MALLRARQSVRERPKEVTRVVGRSLEIGAGSSSQCQGANGHKARVPRDLNCKVGLRRPAESVREQWRAMVSTSVFHFYRFLVVHELREEARVIVEHCSQSTVVPGKRRNEHENIDGADVARSIGRHWPQDRLLAAGIRGPVNRDTAAQKELSHTVKLCDM
jgi:hypothetical protein